MSMDETLTFSVGPGALNGSTLIKYMLTISTPNALRLMHEMLFVLMFTCIGDDYVRA